MLIHYAETLIENSEIVDTMGLTTTPVVSPMSPSVTNCISVFKPHI